ncbi:hypothetical protein ACM64Y_01880 [Novispirillum sp. DQ9]|uniref:hypothetical protein n=1 Tax=Novispirillum sp. DQ9 TaxID=3398612 RepID=UPI003C7EBB98
MPRRPKPTFPRQIIVDGVIVRVYRYLPPDQPVLTMKVPGGRVPPGFENHPDVVAFRNTVLDYWRSIGGDEAAVIAEYNAAVARGEQPRAIKRRPRKSMYDPF